MPRSVARKGARTGLGAPVSSAPAPLPTASPSPPSAPSASRVQRAPAHPAAPAQRRSPLGAPVTDASVADALTGPAALPGPVPSPADPPASPLPPSADIPGAALPSTGASPSPSPVTVQRRTASSRGVPLHRPTPYGSIAAGSALPVAPLSPPPAPTPPALPHSPAGDGASASRPVTVQRTPGSTIGALAASAAATVGETLSRPRPPSATAPDDTPAGTSAPPPYSPLPAGGPSQEQPPPGYEAVPAGEFDPRALTDFQLDELVHRIIGRITRLIRTELRLDRERIGRLRDPRP